ncbi:MAG: DUF4442 domain-containing protein [Flavobacteriales bacterium]
MYQKVVPVLKKILTQAQVYKHLFNLSPLYRNTTGRIIIVSEDLHYIKIKIPLNYQNRNYVGVMFGGSMFSATDPIYMTQLLEILGKDYVVWDKVSTIRYKRPGKSTAYGEFTFSKEEIATIKERIVNEKEINLTKQVNLVSKDGIIFAEIDKTLYIADRLFYKQKMLKK